MAKVYYKFPFLPQICHKYAFFYCKFTTSLFLSTASLTQVFLFYHKSTANTRDVVLGTCTCTRVLLEYHFKVLVLVLVT